jgi:hypothetical protein
MYLQVANTFVYCLGQTNTTQRGNWKVYDDLENCHGPQGEGKYTFIYLLVKEKIFPITALSTEVDGD